VVGVLEIFQYADISCIMPAKINKTNGLYRNYKVNIPDDIALGHKQHFCCQQNKKLWAK